jgi:PDZ domain-containing secreted protein
MQDLMLYDEDFIKKFFSFLQKSYAEHLPKVEETQKRKKKSEDEFAEIPINEAVELLYKAHLNTETYLYDGLLVLSEFIELMAMNIIKIQGDIKELTSAFLSSQNDKANKNHKTKIEEIRLKMAIEDKQRTEAINQIKEMNRYQTWVKRRFEELKKGRYQERI